MLINASVQDVSERNTQILCLELEGKTRFRRYTKQGAENFKMSESYDHKKVMKRLNYGHLYES